MAPVVPAANFSMLALAGWMSVAAALAHFACIALGARAYRFLGAGERMARAAEQGRWYPHLMTFAIGATLLVWAAYAFTATRRAAGIDDLLLPFPRTALVAICAVLLLRGLVVIAPGAWRPDLSLTFKLVSSLIVLAMAAAFIVGTRQAWPFLNAGGSAS